MDVDEQAGVSQTKETARDDEATKKATGRTSQRIQNLAKSGKLVSLAEKDLSSQPKGTRSSSKYFLDKNQTRLTVLYQTHCRSFDVL